MGIFAGTRASEQGRLQMRYPRVTLFRVPGLVIAGLLLGPLFATGQNANRGTAAPAATDWKTPRTPWGDPDLQGYWTTNEMPGVPLERPAAVGGKPFLTEDEATKRREATTQGTVSAEG